MPATAGRRAVAVLTVVSVLALLAGLLLGRFVISPADRAAEAAPPGAGPITAAVEHRVVSSTVTTRADVTYADAVDIEPDVSALSGPAVVTGRVPDVGSTLEAGSVALEVSGRPLILLPGALPAYRTLRAGLSGPDVTELKEALRGLGIDPGAGASDVFDSDTAGAVEELYRRAGYPAPADPEADRAASGARGAVRDARSAVAQATEALRRAEQPAGGSALIELENAVRDAQRDVDAAKAEGAAQARIDQLSDALALAALRRDEGAAAPDSSAERAALEAAGGQLADAESALAEAELQALTALPASEIAYLPTLPRRVDSVSAVRGRPLDGPAMSVSGAALVLEGSAGEQDAGLLREGMPATFSAGSGATYTATVKSVEHADDSADGGTGGDGETGGTGGGSTSEGDAAQDRYTVTFEPETLDERATAALRGENVRVSVPVQSTEGAVLAVPLAAVTAGAEGESRVELVIGTGQEADAAAADAGAVDAGGPDAVEGAATQTVLVTVRTGLAADGYVEIHSDDPRITAGARVVVGR